MRSNFAEPALQSLSSGEVFTGGQLVLNESARSVAALSPTGPVIRLNQGGVRWCAARTAVVLACWLVGLLLARLWPC